MAALELFHAAQPLWREYARFHARWWKEKDVSLRWNPLELREIDDLGRHRDEVFGALRTCAVPGDEENRVDPATVEALLEGVPGRFTDAEAWGACLLLQPASEDGSLWMLSRAKESGDPVQGDHPVGSIPRARTRSR